VSKSYQLSASEAATIIDARGAPVLASLRELWAYRELLYFFVWRDVKVRYKQTVIGFGWAIIQPFFTMVVFTLFFGNLAKMPSDGLPYPVFYFSALVLWLYFAHALQTATNTMVEHQRVITRVYFPRVILPLSAVLSGLVDFAIGCVVLLGIALFYGVVPGLAMVAVLPLLVLVTLLTAFGAGLWLSAMNAMFRDVRYALPFLVQVWMFASPVVYPSSLVPDRWKWLYGLNPMAGVIEGFRWALSGSGQAPGLVFLGSAAGVCLLTVGGLLFFRKMESTIIDVV
jgi:lipopolysaccharide transport system permease protein